MILHAPPSWPALVPNQRPEMCPRAALQAANCTGADKRRRCGLYDDCMDILTVGDGDFSFSLALARALYPDASSAGRRIEGPGRLVATSHESEASVLQVYPNAAATLAELRSRGVAVYHDVDATDLQTTLPPCTQQVPMRFHRVIWNFPCIGRGLEAGQDGQNTEMEANKQLVRDFCCSATPLLWPRRVGQPGGGGEVHITHKTKPPYNHWGLVPLAANADTGLVWRGSVIFDRCSYPPYINRKALGKESFTATDALQYIFGLPAPQDSSNVGVLSPKAIRLSLQTVLLSLPPEHRAVLVHARGVGLDLVALVRQVAATKLCVAGTEEEYLAKKKKLKKSKKDQEKLNGTNGAAVFNARLDGVITPVVESTLCCDLELAASQQQSGREHGTLCPLGYAPLPTTSTAPGSSASSTGRGAGLMSMSWAEVLESCGPGNASTVQSKHWAGGGADGEREADSSQSHCVRVDPWLLARVRASLLKH